MLVFSSTCATCILIFCAVFCHDPSIDIWDTIKAPSCPCVCVEFSKVIVDAGGDELVRWVRVVERHESMGDPLISPSSLRVLDPFHLDNRVSWNAATLFHVLQGGWVFNPHCDGRMGPGGCMSCLISWLDLLPRLLLLLRPFWWCILYFSSGWWPLLVGVVHSAAEGLLVLSGTSCLPPYAVFLH